MSTIPSPCIDICQMDPDTGLCRGCLRTIDEIVAWGTASDAFKNAVWDAIEQRGQSNTMAERLFKA